MVLRARLLDMGEVGALRAHSLCLAVAESLEEESGPVVLLARASSPAVTQGESSPSDGEIDLAACHAARVPVLRLPGAAPAALIEEGALLVRLLLPAARAAQLGLPPHEEGRYAWLRGILAASGVEGEAAFSRVEALAGSLVLTAGIRFGHDPGLAGLIAGRSPAVTGEKAMALPERSPAEVAESFLRGLEERAGLELVPSMPMPQEHEAINAWDRRLATRAETEAAAAGTAA